MSENVPNWYELLLLTGASFRIWRLLAADSILDRPRDWLTRSYEYETASPSTREQEEAISAGYREGLDKFIHCPWCFGFWVIAAVWIAWLIFPTETLIVSAPLAIGTLVGLVAKLDE